MRYYLRNSVHFVCQVLLRYKEILFATRMLFNPLLNIWQRYRLLLERQLIFERATITKIIHPGFVLVFIVHYICTIII